jgi:hypothetical protein
VEVEFNTSSFFLTREEVEGVVHYTLDRGYNQGLIESWNLVKIKHGAVLLDMPL